MLSDSSRRGRCHFMTVTVMVLFFLVHTTTTTVTAAAADAVDVEYDDTTRSDCMQSMTAFLENHPAVDKAAEPYVQSELTSLDFLEMSPGYSMTLSRAPPPTSDITIHYQQACEEAGGIFEFFTGVLDCTKLLSASSSSLTAAPPKPSTSVKIYQHQGTCFPPSPSACDRYTSAEPSSSSSVVALWTIDTEQVFHDACTLREGISSDKDNDEEDTMNSMIMNSALASASPEESMPPGEPHFLTNHDIVMDGETMNHHKRRKACLDAFQDMFQRSSNLQDASMNYQRHSNLELLQFQPILTQRQRYFNVGGSLDHFRQFCQKEKKGRGARFEVWNGTLDCVKQTGTNQQDDDDDDDDNKKRTLVLENAATCFPSGAACSSYGMGQWQVDTLMSLAKEACTIREGSESTTTSLSSSSSSSSSGGDTNQQEHDLESPPQVGGENEQEEDDDDDDDDDDGSLFPIPFVLPAAGGLLLVLVMALFGIIRYQRQRARKVAAGNGNVEYELTPSHLTGEDDDEFLDEADGAAPHVMYTID